VVPTGFDVVREVQYDRNGPGKRRNPEPNHQHRFLWSARAYQCSRADTEAAMLASCSSHCGSVLLREGHLLLYTTPSNSLNIWTSSVRTRCQTSATCFPLPYD